MSHTREPALVGRSHPLRRVRDAFAASSAGRRSAMLVSGEAGMGKTSLIRASIDHSQSDALVVGWGTCWQGDGAPGFWPWMQALGDLVRLVGSGPAVEAAGRDRLVLSALIDELGPAAPITDDPGRHRLLLLDAAVRWLEALAEDRHVVVVLDDLQWADSSTFDLLDHVIAGPAGVRLLVVGAYRHDELDDPATARLAALGAHTDHVHLEGLTADAVEELVAAILDPDAAGEHAEGLHRRTGGHPLFVSELARLPELGTGGPLPTVVTGAVARRLGVVAEETRELLDAASVLGNRLLPDVLGAVVGVPSDEVLRRLGAAASAGLVRTVSGDEIWFAHDLFRETLYEQLEPAARARLHGCVGDALENRRRHGGRVDPGDLARHFARAARSGDPAKAIRWAREAAAEDRIRSAFAEAAGHLRRARSAALDAGWTIEPGTHVRLLIDEADSRARSGEPGEARDLLVLAARIAPDPRHVADVALAVQRLGAKFATRRDEVISHLESALDAVAGVDLIREARVTAALSRELWHSVADDRARAGTLSERALELGRESDDETLIECLLARHDALWTPGTGEERAKLGREIAAVGTRLRDTDRLAEGLILEANGLLESGSARFRPVLDRWFGLLEARDEPRDRYMVATRRAALALLGGDTDDAERLMHQAARIGERIHEPDTGNVLMSQRVGLARARGDTDEWNRLADDAVRWWTGAPLLAHSVAAGARAAAGDLGGAARELSMVAEVDDWRSEGSYLRSVLVAHLAEAAIALDDHALCDELLVDIRPLVGTCGVNGAVVAFAGPFAHTAGILARALGDDEAAQRLIQLSIDTARRLGAHVWVRLGEDLAVGVERQRADDAVAGDRRAGAEQAHLVRAGNVWTASWRGESGSLPHVKGLLDIAVLVENSGSEVPALQLASGVRGTTGSRQDVIDLEALDAYRSRLDDLDVEIDEATAAADTGHVERLEAERALLLAEIRRATGLGGRLRPAPNDPAERARKAVSARIRDAIRRLEEVTPQLANHLDRCIRTGILCSYDRSGDERAVAWEVQR